MQTTTAASVPPPSRSRRAGASALVRLVVAVVVGAACGVLTTALASWQVGLLAGWMGLALVFVVWMWATIWPMTAGDTAQHATREDTGRPVMDAVILLAAVASLGAVALVLLTPSSQSKSLNAALGLLSVGLAWAAIQTLFTARYARLYYQEPLGGVSFGQDDPPQYSDFAYVAFTIGMTFQVSDTDITDTTIRATSLRHALLSYVFGVVIIAAMINLVAGLGS